MENIDLSIFVSANLARAIRKGETRSECSAKTNWISCKEQLMFWRKHSKKKLYHNRQEAAQYKTVVAPANWFGKTLQSKELEKFVVLFHFVWKTFSVALMIEQPKETKAKL